MDMTRWPSITAFKGSDGVDFADDGVGAEATRSVGETSTAPAVTDGDDGSFRL